MSRKNTAAPAPAPAAESENQAASQAAESTDEAQIQGADAGITEATEPAAPSGVVTTDVTPTDDAKAQADGYRVVWHVKAGGKRYEPGEAFPDELVTPELLASGAIVKA